MLLTNSVHFKHELPVEEPVLLDGCIMKELLLTCILQSLLTRMSDHFSLSRTDQFR